MREARLAALKKQLATLPTSARIHFEMASFTEEALMQGLVEEVLPYSDSLGLNEQVGMGKGMGRWEWVRER